MGLTETKLWLNSTGYFHWQPSILVHTVSVQGIGQLSVTIVSAKSNIE